MKKAILVFIDGTICDTRLRHPLIGTPDFYRPAEILKDLAVPGSVLCLNDLALQYQIVYLGARPASTLPATKLWIKTAGFPEGPVYLAENQSGRLGLVREIGSQFDFIAGIGDRWDDNELHAELGCLSIILQEYEGAWHTVRHRLLTAHRQQKIKANAVHLGGKVEGLARVCPLLMEKFGPALWDAYFEAVLERAEQTRAARASEDLASFASRGLSPSDLRDAAKWMDILREEDWQDNPVYGLQDFETVEAEARRYVHKVTRCLYADLWKEHGHPEIGYQIHCRTDVAWWDRPAWNPKVRFEQPKTLMQGDEYCLFIQYLPEDNGTNCDCSGDEP